MRTIKAILIIGFAVSISYPQSIAVEDGAEINAGAGTDICASVWGNISGNLTGSGTQCSGALPVELTSFSAFVENKRNVIIRWETALEINNKGFEIERKRLNEDWLSIGFVEGKGNTNLPASYEFTDKNVNTGTYAYRLKQTDYNGNFKYYMLQTAITISGPADFNLTQNYPNPSNPVCRIDYQIPFDAEVSFKIYDETGKEAAVLVNEHQKADYYTVTFDGTNHASGVYFYRLTAANGTQRFVKTMKLVLIK